MNSKIIKQINNITRELLGNSLINLYHDCRFDQKTKKISWSSGEVLDISYVLKDADYHSIYKTCVDKKAYNYLLTDGSLIQLMYTLDKRSKKIIAHRLAYLPNPTIEIYSNNDDFEGDYYDSLEMFADFIDKNSSPVPVRFDFDINEEYYVEGTHTYSHLTLGNYQNCRIPVTTPITPYKFIDFILKNFYHNKYINFHDRCSENFDILLSDNEQKMIYLKC